MSGYQHRAEAIRAYTAGVIRARDTYRLEQAKPPRRCRTCGDELDGNLPCPCRYEEQP